MPGTRLTIYKRSAVSFIVSMCKKTRDVVSETDDPLNRLLLKLAHASLAAHPNLNTYRKNRSPFGIVSHRFLLLLLPVYRQFPTRQFPIRQFPTLNENFPIDSFPLDEFQLDSFPSDNFPRDNFSPRQFPTMTFSQKTNSHPTFSLYDSFPPRQFLTTTFSLLL